METPTQQTWGVRRGPAQAGEAMFQPLSTPRRAPLLFGSKMKIKLELDAVQLDILLSQIESMFRESHERGIEAIDREVDLAVKHWRPDYAGGFEYEIVKMAPIYRQLLSHCASVGGPVGIVSGADDLISFVQAVRVARLGETGEVSHAC